MHESLALAAEDRAWSLLLRHAERPEIPAGSFGSDLAITERGRRQAAALGRLLGRRLRRLVQSPVLRCRQTAEAIRLGAGAPGQAATDRRLGDPGVWITDIGAAGDLFMKHGPQGVVARQLAGDPLPGMIALAAGAKRLLELLTSAPGAAGTIDVYVSHDAVIAPLLAAILGAPDDLSDIWSAYLEGPLLSHSVDGLDVIWRGVRRSVQWGLT